MRNNRDRDWNDNMYEGDRNREWHDYNRFVNDEYTQRPESRHHMSEQQQRRQQNYDRQRGNYHPNQEDYYNALYDTANYGGQPRHVEYGLYHGTEDDLEAMRPMYPQAEGPYAQRRRYNYTLGYNPNFDNPEEGDMYRDFDSRGNHGYRHDASYGNQDEFRDFGGDHYGSPDQSSRFRDYDRY